MSLGTFFAYTFAICVGFDQLFPGIAMYETWLKLSPGFTWLSWSFIQIAKISKESGGDCEAMTGHDDKGI